MRMWCEVRLPARAYNMTTTFIKGWGYSVLAFLCLSCGSQKEVQEEQTADVEPLSLSWVGVYEGTLPCGDCQGIQTVIELKADSSYLYQAKFLGVQDSTIFDSSGEIAWNAAGSAFMLEGMHGQEEFHQYAVAEKSLIKLNREGKQITGSLASKYILNKAGLTNRYWKLIELYGRPVEANTNTNEPHLILTDKNGATGNAGCNGFNGTYSIKGNEIRFSKMISTMMACIQMDSESQFLHILEDVDNYSLQGNQLLLRKAQMSPLARFEAIYFK